MSWWSVPFIKLRWLVRAVRTQERIAVALERLADEIAPRRDVPPVTPEAPTIARPTGVDFAQVEALRGRLQETLGREPSDDELAVAYEDEELTGEEETTVPAVLRARANGGILR